MGGGGRRGKGGGGEEEAEGIARPVSRRECRGLTHRGTGEDRDS